MQYFRCIATSLPLILLLANIRLSAQDSSINYDESKIPLYTLPDALQLKDGRRITTAKEWMQQQRPAMLKLFADNVYGRIPIAIGTGKPKNMRFKIFDVDSNALRGKAIRKQVTIYFTSGAEAPSMDVLMYLPKGR
ncbi:MAG TPA: hypothetical protein VGQ53_01270, partial [Chitinophagaceae bacterium]|nr:hypothetical protein [Chitinophagaceae bacterium]